LKQPFGPFLGIFEVGSMPMIPKHIYEGTDFKTNPANNTPVGTGPFMFQGMAEGARFIHLVKNPNYYIKGQALHRRDLLARPFPTQRRESVAFETGKGRCAAGRLGGEFRRSAPDQTQETSVLAAAGWGILQPTLMGSGSTTVPARPANKKFRQGRDVSHWIVTSPRT